MTNHLYGWEPAWQQTVDRIVGPTLEAAAGEAVATGALGIWWHGLLHRPPTIDGIRIVTRTADTPQQLLALLAAAAGGAGARLMPTTARPPALTATLTHASLALPVTVAHQPLPDAAFDDLFGHWRLTTAAWLLAVEALTRTAMAPPGPVADAAATDLQVLRDATDPAEGSWHDAIRLAGPAALDPYLDRPGPYTSAELRDLADLAAGADR